MLCGISCELAGCVHWPNVDLVSRGVAMVSRGVAMVSQGVAIQIF
jgi:hypothetical protein